MIVSRHDGLAGLAAGTACCPTLHSNTKVLTRQGLWRIYAV